MKNKETGLPKENGFLTFADLANQVINVPPEGGFDLDEMELRLSMRKKLNEANDTIKMSAEEFAKLKELVLAPFKFGIMHEDLVDFIKTVKEL